MQLTIARPRQRPRAARSPSANDAATARQKVAALVGRLTESQLVALIARMDRPSLLLLESACGLRDCDCEPDEADGPCPHQLGDHVALPAAAAAAVLSRLHPGDYAEPPAPPAAAVTPFQAGMVSVMASRAAAGVALARADDGVNRHTGLERYGRAIGRQRNGSDVVGAILADADFAGDDDEDLDAPPPARKAGETEFERIHRMRIEHARRH